MDVPRLHPDTIEEVKQRVDIVDVIADYVVLKKRGKDYLGLCPFHNEKTPSFSVSPSKQMYYCFGCGEGGNAFKFLMELGKQSFSEVVFELARTYQVPIKTLEPEQKQELQRELSLREQLYEILAVSTRFYQHALSQPQGENALTYLKTQRHLKDTTIQQFELGYAPAGWETLYRYLVEQKRYPVQLIEDAGLIKPRKDGNGHYDTFRDRLMIPIHDSQGRVIAFGSRTLGNDEPKYLNSPETSLFNKRKTLFALDKAKNAIRTQDQAIVVEGYFDAIALHSHHITCAVASLGTAFTPEHLRQLLRYTDSKQVIFNFDADNAGITATQRAIAEIEPLIYSGQVQLRILNLIEGKDADEFLNASEKATEIYQDSLKNAPLWFDWQIQQLLKNKDLKQANYFEQVAQEMLKLLNRLEDSNKRAYYIRYCAEILALGDARLIPLQVNNLQRQLKKPVSRSPNAKRRQPLNKVISSEKNLLEEAEALLLRIYLNYPELRLEISNSMEEKDLLFSFSHHRFLWQQMSAVQSQDESIVTNSRNLLLSRLQDHLLAFPAQLSRINHLFHLDEKTSEDIFRAEVRIKEAIAALERVSWEKYQQYCLEKWQNLNPAQDFEQFRYYSQEINRAQQHILELDQIRLDQSKEVI